MKFTTATLALTSIGQAFAFIPPSSSTDGPATSTSSSFTKTFITGHQRSSSSSAASASSSSSGFKLFAFKDKKGGGSFDDGAYDKLLNNMNIDRDSLPPSPPAEQAPPAPVQTVETVASSSPPPPVVIVETPPPIVTVTPPEPPVAVVTPEPEVVQSTVNDLVESVKSIADNAIQASEKATEIATNGVSTPSPDELATATTAAASTAAAKSALFTKTSTATKAAVAAGSAPTLIDYLKSKPIKPFLSDSYTTTVGGGDDGSTTPPPNLMEYIKNEPILKDPPRVSLPPDTQGKLELMRSNLVNMGNPDSETIKITSKVVQDLEKGVVESSNKLTGGAVDVSNININVPNVNDVDMTAFQTLLDQLNMEQNGPWYVAGTAVLVALLQRNAGKEAALRMYEEELLDAQSRADEAADAAATAAKGARMAKELAEQLPVKKEPTVGEVLLTNSKVKELQVDKEMMEASMTELKQEAAQLKVLLAKLVKEKQAAEKLAKNMGVEIEIPLIKETMKPDPEEDKRILAVLKEIDEENAVKSAAKAAAAAKAAVKPPAKKSTRKKRAPAKKKSPAKKKASTTTVKVIAEEATTATTTKTETTPVAKKKKAPAKKKTVVAKAAAKNSTVAKTAAKKTVVAKAAATVKKTPAKKKTAAKKKAAPKKKAATTVTAAAATPDKIAESFFAKPSTTTDETPMPDTDLLLKEINDAVTPESKTASDLLAQEAEIKVNGSSSKAEEKKKAPTAAKESKDGKNPWGGLKESTLKRKTIAQLTAYLDERNVDAKGKSKKELVGIVQNM